MKQVCVLSCSRRPLPSSVTAAASEEMRRKQPVTPPCLMSCQCDRPRRNTVQACTASAVPQNIGRPRCNLYSPSHNRKVVSSWTRCQGHARLLVQPPVGLPPVGAVQRHALRVDVVQRDAQLPRQHRQRVAVDARQDAAAQVRHRRQAATLQQMRSQGLIACQRYMRAPVACACPAV